MSAFERTIVVDWSAASTPGPKRPSPNRVWVAWVDDDAGRTGGTGGVRTAYCRTRAAAIDLLAQRVAAVKGAVLIGVDFPLGYPVRAGPGPVRAVLPAGWALAAMWAQRVTDGPDDQNNRFEAAAAVNREVLAGAGAVDDAGCGPLWGCPRTVSHVGLSATKPGAAVWAVVQEERRCERWLRGLGWRPQSPWKLAGAGSVGSQAIMGLAALHRLRARLGGRARLWPMETGWAGQRIDRADPVVIAEVYPTLTEADHSGSVARAIDPAHRTVRDARQAAALAWVLARTEREHLLRRPEGLSGADAAVAEASEGWVMGPAGVRTRR